MLSFFYSSISFMKELIRFLSSKIEFTTESKLSAFGYAPPSIVKISTKTVRRYIASHTKYKITVPWFLSRMVGSLKVALSCSYTIVRTICGFNWWPRCCKSFWMWILITSFFHPPSKTVDGHYLRLCTDKRCRLFLDKPPGSDNQLHFLLNFFCTVISFFASYFFLFLWINGFCAN